MDEENDTINAEVFMSIYEKAKKFATAAHEGMTRKGSNEPYINHPMEVAEIVKTMSDNEGVWAAALLHDTIEDTPTTFENIKREFGEKIADLVMADTENKRENLPPSETWKIRKKETIGFLHNKATDDEKKLVLSDKLSNMRRIQQDYEKVGDEVWGRFNQKDKSEHAWYYKSILEETRELDRYPAWQEYKKLVEKVFG